MDIARALKKVQETVIASNHADKFNPNKDEKIRATAEMVGSAETFVREHLNLLEESREIQDALDKELIGVFLF